VHKPAIIIVVAAMSDCIVPLADAEHVPSDDPPADHILEQRRQATAALAAISELPDRLREPATLFFVHECSHQDVATFLGLSVATVNNRLHAARSRLKQRMLTMVADTLHSNALPDDFASRIGRLIEARGDLVEALFDPGTLRLLDPPDTIRRKVSRAVTDSGREVLFNINEKPGVANLLTILAACTGTTPVDAAAGLDSYRELKEAVAEAVIAVLAPLQERYAGLSADPGAIEAMARDGAARAQDLAAPTLARAQRAMGLLAA